MKKLIHIYAVPTALATVATALSLGLLSGGAAANEELLKRGETVYTANCLACHQATGQGIPPAFPALVGSEVVLGPSATQIDIILNGRPGTTMQAFGALLSDEDIAAVIAYTRDAWGNRGKTTGEPVTAADVAALRK